jgi:hypothetical protein
MAEIVPVTTTYEVNKVSEGSYEVTQVVEEEQPNLNSGNRQEFAIDIKIVSVWIPMPASWRRQPRSRPLAIHFERVAADD